MVAGQNDGFADGSLGGGFFCEPVAEELGFVGVKFAEEDKDAATVEPGDEDVDVDVATADAAGHVEANTDIG